MVTLQAQKTVESQKLELKDQEMERTIAAQNRGRLAATQRQLKALQWEHEVRAGPSADRRQLAGFTFLLGFQDLGKWQLAMHDLHQGIDCEGYDGSGCMTFLMKLRVACARRRRIIISVPANSGLIRCLVPHRRAS